MRTTRFFLKAASAACLCAGAAFPAFAVGEASAGKVTGFPVPRYVSLKTDRVNLREGPSKEHRTAWAGTAPASIRATLAAARKNRVVRKLGLPSELSLSQPLLERQRVTIMAVAISRRCTVKGA